MFDLRTRKLYLFKKRQKSKDFPLLFCKNIFRSGAFMKTLKTFVLPLLLIAAVPLLQGCGKKSELKAELVHESVYTTEDSMFTARFYSLSDRSLYFVKVQFNDEEMTLSRALSASGERYVDETGKIEFLVKENEAQLLVLSSESGHFETELKGTSE